MKIAASKFKWLVLLLFIVAGFLLYANSFSNQLFWDDHDGIVNNAYIKDWSYWPHFFSENLIAGSGQVSNYWRPLVLFSFACEYHLAGLDPAIYHLSNLLWHVLAAWLVFLLFSRLGAKRYLALGAALIFLAHPLQTEAVTYVSGRADPMAAVFTLAALLAYTVFRQKKRLVFLLLSLGAFVLSLLCKEQSIILPGLVLLIEACFFFNRKRWHQSLAAFWPYVLLALVYLAARLLFLDFNGLLSGIDYSDNYDSSLGVRLLTFTYVFSKYLALLFAPFQLHMAYEVAPVTSLFSWPPLLFLFLLVSLALVFHYYWSRNRLVVFGLSWFLIILLPRTNIVSINRPLYEHWLYLPLAGFWLALIYIGADVLSSWKRKKETFFILLSLAFLYFGWLTVRRNLDWRDPITFYEKNLHYTPHSFIQRNNLGMAYADAGRFSDAIAQYRQALALSDRYPQVHSNLANALVVVGETAAAEKEYYRALEMDPGFTIPYINLLRLAILERDRAGLEEVLGKMAENFPRDVYLRESFHAYYQLGDFEKARTVGQELVSRFPEADSNISFWLWNNK